MGQESTSSKDIRQAAADPIPTPPPQPAVPDAADDDLARTSSTRKKPVSGLYKMARSSHHGHSGSGFPPRLTRAVIRLDVDRTYPQMTVSGSGNIGRDRIHWIAKVSKTGSKKWSGSIWYKDGAVAVFPYTEVEVAVKTVGGKRRATVVFGGGGLAKLTTKYQFRSRYFHPIELEFDVEVNVDSVSEYHTGSHPNRPPTLASERLTIPKVFRRTGFDVCVASPGAPVPVDGASTDLVWSDNEMHDAMQVQWSSFANVAQWSMWTFFARQHEMGPGLGGIMFDDIGAQQRQGSAVFLESFISDPPPGDPAPDAAIARSRFWTTVHEMGHAFNLAHSWQKSLGTPWIPLLDEPEARSFMNYPYGVAGGQAAFFSDFEFRFSDGELLYVRHAPDTLVRPGDALWFDHHGFERETEQRDPGLRLEIGVTHPDGVLEFLEPAVLELRLVNEGDEPVLVPESILDSGDALTVIIKKQGKTARQYVPFARYCMRGKRMALAPGNQIAGSVFVGAGLGGWELAEPGVYLVQASLKVGTEEVVSEPLVLKVSPPAGAEEDKLAQDLFSEEVGRILAFDGSLFLNRGNETLRRAAAQFPDRRIAYHADIALTMPLLRNYKLMTGARAERKIQMRSAKVEEAASVLKQRVLKDPASAVRTLGSNDYEYYLERFSRAVVGKELKIDRDKAVLARKTIHWGTVAQSRRRLFELRL